MKLVCPVCSSPDFQIVDSVEMGMDSFWDESTIQRANCRSCHTCFYCTYEEKRSYNPNRDDKVSHVAFIARKPVWYLSSFIFSKPVRRRAALWRAYVAKYVFENFRTQDDALPIKVSSSG